jgi:Mg-chelatase subunit ChlD
MFRRYLTLPAPRRALPAFLAAVLFVLALSGTLLTLARIRSAGPVELVPLDRTDSACTNSITTTLAPASRRLCDPIAVTTTFTAGCPVCPDGLNVIFIQDDTPYPDWQKRVSLQALDELQRFAMGGSDVSVGVIHYNGQGIRRALRPTLNLGAARGPLTGFNVAHDPRALFLEAAKAGVQMVREGRQLHGDKATPECEFIIFFVYTKIYMQDKGEEMIEAGRLIRRDVRNLYVGCPHQHPEECTIWEPRVPESERYYTEDPEASKLLGMVRGGLREIETTGLVKIRTMTTDQWLPPSLSVLPGSFSLPPATTVKDGERTKMTWSWRPVRLGEAITVTFKAEPEAPGQARSEVRAVWSDSQNRRGERSQMSAPVTILDDDCSTPTPTLTSTPPPTPTETPVPSVTPTTVPSATPTWTPVPTPTPVPQPIYVPLLLSEQCVPGDIHGDVVLVIDTSTSMRRLSRTSRTKLAATLDAAKTFVGLMVLTPDTDGISDRVAVVGFNDTAWVQLHLSRDRAAIEQALDALPPLMKEGTRLDLALAAGAVALAPERRQPGNTPVMILLTDGLPNRVPLAEDGSQETTVLRAAAAAKATGIDVYTIAIGAATDTNPALLTGCASVADHYYYTPDPEDLATIYKAIAHAIGCPPDAFWGRR